MNSIPRVPFFIHFWSHGSLVALLIRLKHSLNIIVWFSFPKCVHFLHKMCSNDNNIFQKWPLSMPNLVLLLILADLLSCPHNFLIPFQLFSTIFLHFLRPLLLPILAPHVFPRVVGAHSFFFVPLAITSGHTFAPHLVFLVPTISFLPNLPHPFLVPTSLFS